MVCSSAPPDLTLLLAALTSRLHFEMKRAYFLLIPLLGLAGCQPSRPPSPGSLKLIKEQTAIGPVHTKLQAKPFTYPVRAGELSLWDIKIFDIKDKENGLRQEWKNFAQLPQQLGTQVNNTQVLMNGWIISQDGTIFLPQKPTYKGYGSFYTDWTLPRPGPYALWIEYRPSVAHNEELSAGELLDRKASYNLPREVGSWNFNAVGEKLTGAPDVGDTSSVRASTSEGQPLAIYDAKGARAGAIALLKPVKARVNRALKLQWTVSGTPLEDPEIVAIAPDRSTLLHGIGAAPELTFGTAGTWKIWFSFVRDGQSFAAPYSLNVAP